MARKTTDPAIIAAQITAALEAAKVVYDYATSSYLAALEGRHAAQQEFPRATVTITERRGKHGTTYYVVKAVVP